MSRTTLCSDAPWRLPPLLFSSLPISGKTRAVRVFPDIVYSKIKITRAVTLSYTIALPDLFLPSAGRCPAPAPGYRYSDRVPALYSESGPADYLRDRYPYPRSGERVLAGYYRCAHYGRMLRRALPASYLAIRGLGCLGPLPESLPVQSGSGYLDR